MYRIDDIIKDRFRIRDLKPDGGQSTTYVALDRISQTDVILQQLKAPSKSEHLDLAVARLERSSTLGIDHPRVLAPSEIFKWKGQWFSVAPLCDGPTLDALVAMSGGRLDPQLARLLIDEIADALIAVHARGVIHRDLKPSNIIIHPTNGAHLIDFGICRVTTEPTLTKGADLLGTVPFLAPEQVDDATKVDLRADLFSLGGVLFQMLTGRPHIEGDSIADLLMKLRKPPTHRPIDLVPSTPKELDEICMRLLARHPRHRFQTAEAVRAALAAGGKATPGVKSTCTGCHRPVIGDGAFCSHCGAASRAVANDRPRCLACGCPCDNLHQCPGCNRCFSPEEHQLIFLQGASSNLRFRIPQGIFTVGRDQICPRDRHVSGRQFAVASQNGAVQIEHAGSVNMTFIANQPATTICTLACDQEIRFAGHLARYQRS